MDKIISVIMPFVWDTNIFKINLTKKEKKKGEKHESE